MVSTVDVLLACYNGEKHLPAQLRSLENQTLTDYSVLMQDDGSQDGTRRILEEIAERDSRFRMAEENDRHFGAAGNFMSLLRQSTAPYTAFADQDDLWYPEKLSACLMAMRETEDAYGADTPILIHSDLTVVNEAGDTLHNSLFRHQGWDDQAVALRQLLVQNNATGCTMLMNEPLRRIAAALGRSEDMFMHDWYIALTAAACGCIRILPRPLMAYRQHGSNVLGANPDSLPARAVKALGKLRQAKDRIALTYRNAEMFLHSFDSCPEALPTEMRHVIEDYLASEALPKWQRIRFLKKGGYIMQSPVTRAGQMLLG